MVQLYPVENYFLICNSKMDVKRYQIYLIVII